MFDSKTDPTIMLARAQELLHKYPAEFSAFLNSLEKVDNAVQRLTEIGNSGHIDRAVISDIYRCARNIGRLARANFVFGIVERMDDETAGAVDELLEKVQCGG